MKSKIKFVRSYEFYGFDCFDVVYHSGRVRTFTENEKLPRTVSDFIINAPKAKRVFDKTFNRTEDIYSY